MSEFVQFAAYVIPLCAGIWFVAEKIGKLDTRIQVFINATNYKIEKGITEAKNYADDQIITVEKRVSDHDTRIIKIERRNVQHG